MMLTIILLKEQFLVLTELCKMMLTTIIIILLKEQFLILSSGRTVPCSNKTVKDDALGLHLTAITIKQIYTNASLPRYFFYHFFVIPFLDILYIAKAVSYTHLTLPTTPYV